MKIKDFQRLPKIFQFLIGDRLSKQAIYTFTEISKGLDMPDKLRLILFTAGVKPNTYVILKINPQDLGEKYRFEQLLKENKIHFLASRQKGYEEITKIVKNKIIWEFKGVWVGYDLFKNEKSKKDFLKYKKFASKRQHKKEILLAGKLYGYPKCCINNYLKETPEYIKKHYTCYQFYKRLHDTERKFSFVFHTICSAECKATAKLNKLYSSTIKKFTPKLWKQYTKTDSFKSEIIVDKESDILLNKKTIWPERDGHEYEIILRQPHNKKYYLYAYLTKHTYKRGTILKADIKQKYNYADITVKKTVGILPNLMHERKMPLISRKY